VDIAKKLPTVIAFCAGYGGIERGLDLAGIEHRVIAYVEIEAFAIANLVQKMEDGQLPPAPIYTDIKTFPAEVFRGKVSILTGGYPCQPFSAAGKRLGEDDPRHLWPHIRRHIESIRPARCFFENVEGHISLGLSSVISDLEEDCYRATWGIFSAREVGAPHQRKRVYILAESNDDRHKQNPQRDAKESGVQGEYWSEVCRGMPDRASNESTAELADSSRNGGGRELRNLSSENESIGKPKKHWKNSPRLPDDAGQNAGANSLGDSSSTRSSTWLSRPERSDKERHSEVANNSSDRSGWRQVGMPWPTEPRLGRVVDGCADRVDRIRLLGNGVVPQTAAKAWTVLSERLV
jgi:DNA (cytosine-5)-methyltransferase 1